jgi:hypothetical protein
MVVRNDNKQGQSLEVDLLDGNVKGFSNLMTISKGRFMFTCFVMTNRRQCNAASFGKLALTDSTLNTPIFYRTHYKQHNIILKTY